MRRWLSKVLARIRGLSLTRRVFFTLKARQELTALDVGLDQDDASAVLAVLSFEDCAGRLRSITTDEWMYVFKPTLAGTRLFIKVVLRYECVVVSFHEDEGGSHEEQE